MATTMKREQQFYSKQRVIETRTRKIDALRKKFTKPAKDASDAEKLKAIKGGDVSLRYGAKLSSPLSEAFDFDGLDHSEVLDRKAFDVAANEVRQKADKIMDEIMLGDATKAIKSVRQFCD